MVVRCGCKECVDPDEAEAQAQATVDMFLRAYEKRPAPSRKR